MPGRQCKEMIEALSLYDKRPTGISVSDIAKKAGVSRAGLYDALARRKTTTTKGKKS